VLTRALLQCSLLIGNIMAYFLIQGETIERETRALDCCIQHHHRDLSAADEAHRFYQILFGTACGGVGLFFFLRPSESKVMISYSSRLDKNDEDDGCLGAADRGFTSE